MKKHLSTILLVGMFFVGLSVLLYPTVSNYWNSKVQSKVVANYDTIVENMDAEEHEQYLNAARAYNEQLRQLTFPLQDYKQLGNYEETLDIDGSGVMGYIDIDKINVELPIYHGISAPVLSVAAGHLPGTSFPVGGPGTHAVISAHRGLPSAKLFTNLDKLEEGDTFRITVLDEVLTYQIDQILIVEPDDVDALAIEEGQDYCTLLTCTPYGINSHRLLVRGHRTETVEPKNNFVPNDAIRIDPLVVAPVVAAPMLLILMIIVMLKYRKKRGK